MPLVAFAPGDAAQLLEEFARELLKQIPDATDDASARTAAVRLVAVDAIMRRANGLRFLERLRAAPPTAGHPFTAMVPRGIALN